MDARGEVLTASRVAEVIARTFGVRDHRDHVGRLLREAGGSREPPIERATPRNEEAIKEWSEERWPHIKKSRVGQSYHHLGRRSRLLTDRAGIRSLKTRERDHAERFAGIVDGGESATFQISSNTVQDHLKAIFDKVGVRSRRELVGQLFTQQYQPRLVSGRSLDANGWFT